MNILWLEDFKALADHLNFSKAADARNVTQPAFSRRIKSLEDVYGTNLVDRSSHRLTLTEAGELVLTAAIEVTRRLDGLHQEIEQVKSAERSLSFASTHALSFSFFPQWFKTLPAPAASAPLHLLADNMKACERMMMDGRAQFLLCHAHPEAEILLPEQSFKAAQIASDQLVPVAKGGEGDKAIYDLDKAPFEETPLLAFDETSGMGRIVHAAIGPQLNGLRLRRAFASHLVIALKALALDGKGIAWVPISIVQEELASGALALAGGDKWRVPVSIVLLRSRSRQSALAERFWQLATKQVGGAHNGPQLRAP